jgi:uncharacterized protein (TIGR00288 family)
VRRLPDTHVGEGYARRRRGVLQQKGVDVRLAVDALEAAVAQRVRIIGPVAGDADFVPLVEAIRRAGPHMVVLAFRESLAAELRGAADRVVFLPDEPADWASPPE